MTLRVGRAIAADSVRQICGEQIASTMSTLTDKNLGSREVVHEARKRPQGTAARVGGWCRAWQGRLGRPAIAAAPMEGGSDHNEEAVAMANPSIKDEELYESLREEGSSKEKAARIANAAAARGRSEVGKKGGSKPPYEKWTKDELLQRARELEIEGRSTMTKDELVQALRSH